MSDFKPTVGTIAWLDLTVPEADDVRDFYREVVGWEHEPVSMGDYEDFNMNIPGTGTAVAGICHARGSNADFPPHWLPYVVVEDAEESAERCRELGGEVVVPLRPLGDEARYCVIRDPSGAVIALYSEEGGPV